MTLRCPEMSASYYLLTKRRIPQERNPQLHGRKNLKIFTRALCETFLSYPLDYWIDILPGSGCREGDFFVCVGGGGSLVALG
jgi:hypothetical protein